MTNKQIIEGNKLIAEFMGAEYEIGRYSHESSEFFFTIEELEYHSSWDWIMPVVEKIESLVFPNDEFYNIHILGGCQVYIICSNMDEFGDYSESTKLLTVYKAVVEFIKWYNNRDK